MLLVGLALCSCSSAEVIFPPDGATGVPVDSQIAFVSIHDDLAPRLVGVGAEEVALEVTRINPGDAVYGWYILQPNAPLAAHTDYSFLPFGESVWSGFRTGAASGAAAPARPVLHGVTAQRVPDACFSSCYGGEREFVEVELTPDPSAAYYEISFAGQAVPGLSFAGRLLLDSGFCFFPPPRQIPGATTCLTVTAVSQSGGRSGPSEEVCVVVEDCPLATCEGSFPECAAAQGDGSRGGCAVAAPAGPAMIPALLFAALARRRAAKGGFFKRARP